MMEPGIFVFWLVATLTLVNFAILITILFLVMELSLEVFESKHEVGRLADTFL